MPPHLPHLATRLTMSVGSAARSSAAAMNSQRPSCSRVPAQADAAGATVLSPFQSLCGARQGACLGPASPAAKGSLGFRFQFLFPKG